DRGEARGVLAHDRAAQLVGGRTRDDRERDLRADAVHGQELDEEVALGALGEAVELEDVLAHVEVRLDRDLAACIRLPDGARRGGDEVADAADVEHEALRGRGDGRSPQPRDHPASLRSGGASAWQMATASASAAWFGVGSASSPRIAFTIRCTCAFSARP